MAQATPQNLNSRLREHCRRLCPDEAAQLENAFGELASLLNRLDVDDKAARELLQVARIAHGAVNGWSVKRIATALSRSPRHIQLHKADKNLKELGENINRMVERSNLDVKILRVTLDRSLTAKAMAGMFKTTEDSLASHANALVRSGHLRRDRVEGEIRYLGTGKRLYVLPEAKAPAEREHRAVHLTKHFFPPAPGTPIQLIGQALTRKGAESVRLLLDRENISLPTTLAITKRDTESEVRRGGPAAGTCAVVITFGTCLKNDTGSKVARRHLQKYKSGESEVLPTVGGLDEQAQAAFMAEDLPLIAKELQCYLVDAAKLGTGRKAQYGLTLWFAALSEKGEAKC